MSPNTRAVRTNRAPAAIGPYSQGIVVPELGLVFTSGQIGIAPETSELVPGGAAAEMRQILSNIRAVLDEAGSGLDHIVKTTLYLTDLGDFGSVNAVYAEVIDVPHPARSTVGVASLPKGARVEMDVIAAVVADTPGGPAR